MATETLHSKVAGVTAENPDGRPRQICIRAYCKPGMPLILRREPSNPYDANAIAVWIKARALFFFTAELQIGYLNKELAQEMARHIDRGGKLSGSITEVTGGTREKPTRGVNILFTKA